MDIFPTILSLLEINFAGHESIKDTHKGMDISGNILKEQDIRRPYLFWDSYEIKSSAAIKDNRWKWIRKKSGKDLLFDLMDDPFENHNIEAKHPQLLKTIKSAHQQFRAANNIEPYPDDKKITALQPIDKLKKSERQTRAMIKRINDEPVLEAKQSLEITDDMIEITGIAIDSHERNLAVGVYIKIDDQLFEAKYGIPDEGIVKHTKEKKYYKSGFFVEIPKNKLKKGKCDISLLVISSDRKTYYEQKKKVSIKVN